VCDDRSVVLTTDGRELGELAAGDTVSCRGGDLSARIVTFGPRDFHQILKAKFGLSDR
jgi:NAD kinase